MNILNKRWLAIDASNLLYRTFFAHKMEDDTTIAGFAHHSALTTINKYFKQFKPHKLVLAFDRKSWRKDYTASHECISKRPYKGNRRQSMTPSDKIKYQMFLKHLADFEMMMREHTSAIILAGDRLEADDLLSGFVQVMTMEEDNEIVIISGDKDMIQLLGYPNTRLVDPATGKDRTLTEWNDDADYFLFEKNLRGDAGDNIFAALPRVRSTRIEKAYKNEFERVNLMKETWKSPDGREFVVGDLFVENEKLMDLRKQPEDIQVQIIRTVMSAINNPGKFSYLHFMKFLGKFELKKIAENAEQFTNMLSR